MAKGLKVLMVSSEVFPFSKTGGLADVVGSLPSAIHNLGLDIRVATPRYKSVKVYGNEARLNNDVPVYFVEHEGYFMRDNLYGTKAGDYPDNLDRFAFFSKKVLEVLKDLDFKPDIIHCNDWQTALIPVYLKTIFKDDPFYKGTKTIFTIHNIGYQGLFPKEGFPKTDLPWELFNINGLEFYDKVNILKGGLIFSDIITTVSPTYSKEIQTKEFGYGLDGVLAQRSDSIFGIVNGIDYEAWNPSKDKALKHHFSSANIDGKYKEKKMLQRDCGLKEDVNTPLIGIISRLVDQKGIDLISQIINPLLKMDVQFILLGTGEEKYHTLFGRIKRKYPGKASTNLRFDAVLAKIIYAGSDMFLMPSKYEPCGLGQLISLRYGTIPIVRRSGGLADTIVEYNPKTGRGTGFVFEKYEANELFGAIKRALHLYKDKSAWRRLVIKAMKCDFSWEGSAKRYVELYKKLKTQR
ncbi:MAG: glycogen synthase [Omnitrophica WOR_2 bacterium SM23_29]|nr:MAG: glycogen synthase [Omnitrophica WOR_2 bacterium SM23_29]